MPSTNPKTSIEVFISYAHADQELRKKLEEYLSSPSLSGKITIWHEQKIQPGANWEDQIDAHLNEADMILLLVSSSFMASERCWRKQVQTALSRHKAGSVWVIPILLRFALWEETPLGQLEALPTGARPVTEWDNQDAAFGNVVRGIQKVVDDLLRILQEEAQPKEEPETMAQTPEEAAHLQSARQTANVEQKLTPALYSGPPGNVLSSSQHPTSTRPKRRRVALALILLILVIIGAGSFGLYTASKRTESTSQGQPISPTATPPANVTSTALVTATPTAPATVNSPGQVWHSRISGTTKELLGVVWSGTQFVVVGDGYISTSSDGITWTLPQTFGQAFYGIAWSGTRFVVVGETGIIMVSLNGTKWAYQNYPTSAYLRGIAWSGSQFVAVGDGGTILTSPNGVTWTAQTSRTSDNLNSVAWSGTQFVVVGDGCILTSSDGITWVPPQTFGQTFYGIAWLGSQFMVVGGNGVILTSPDGVKWTPRTSRTSDNLRGVAWSGSQFVAVGMHGVILTSLDEVSWNAQTSRTSDNNLNSVAWSGTQFVIVGAGFDGGVILTSS